MSDIYSSYKPIEVAQSNATTDTEYNISTAYSGSAKLLSRAFKMYIQTDQTVTIKFASASGDPITVTSAMGRIYFENLLIEKVFITNASGSTANLKLLFVGVEKQP